MTRTEDVASVNQKSLCGMLEFVNASTVASGIPVTINFLRNFTIEGIEPFLQYHCKLAGLVPQVTFGNYDMVYQEILDSQSHLYHSSPDLIVLSLYLDTYLPDGWRASWRADQVMSGLATLLGDVAKNTDCIIALNTFIPPYYSDCGISMDKDTPSHYDEVLKLNQLIRAYIMANHSRFILIDWERFVRLLGADESMDYRFWYMSKAPFKKGFLDLYAQELVKVLKALKGKSRKCLILDCDNTLWGGVIGEDGLQGIKLDRHTYPGNIFFEFQKSIIKLHDRGVLIALCSKNNEQDVFDVLDNHPDSLLKREYFAAWRINWNDKASNISSIASELNLGIDSFVFVDDNPVECSLVQNMLPEVVVFQVPEKLYKYPQLLLQNALFETLNVSSEDRVRSQLYRSEGNRKDEQGKFETLQVYLESLSLSIKVHEVKDDEVSRVAQLTQKTNQFNLTTRRYSESRIKAISNSSEWAVITLFVNDKFGASGLTGVLIARKEGNSGIIDSFLMSCRILGRGIEKAFIREALFILEQSWGEKCWIAEYIPTNKNQQVADFWSTAGFREVERLDRHVLYEFSDSVTSIKKISYIAIEE